MGGKTPSSMIKKAVFSERFDLVILGCYNQIVFIARNAENRRGPQVALNYIKNMRRMRRRRKRKSNMTTKLARMAEVLSRNPSTRSIGTTTELS